ncbi:RAD52 family DNA repair protein [Brevundimonas sp.]|uniref:RAD52 family DNA repair protein n=1 Tax=Brevundimonas sp. TaxID=1871086 RepID=UPI002898966E|nr:RAD52 family DNA repair protein [Brevundimonas sp.]
MSFTPETIKALEAPLDRGHVATRQQAGRSLSYIEAWHAIAEANRIFGFDGWNRETVDLRLLGQPREVDGKWRVGYSAKVRITVFAGERTIIREGCGFGSGIDKDVDQAHESALKEAESDAMKRALMTFGNPFGLALYDKSQSSVASAAVMAATVAIELCKTEADLSKWSADNKAVLDSLNDADLKAVRRVYSDHLKVIRNAAPSTPFDEAA